MRAPCDDSIEKPVFAPPPQSVVPADAIVRAAEILARAERPIILAGGGALWSGAADKIETLAGLLGAPVVTTLNGKGLLDERHPLSLGHARSSRCRQVLPHADVMLAVGCRFTEVMTDWRRMSIPKTLIQIDLDPEQIGMNYPVALGIVADVRAAVDALISMLPPQQKRDGWGKLWSEARVARPAKPEWLIDTLREVLPGDIPVFTDACEIGYRMQADWLVFGPRQFFYPSNYITLGWAFPAAVGAAVARAGAPVVSVSGDGGFVMTSQELATAVRYRLPTIVLVHNDSAYGAIKNIQKHAYDGRYLDVDLNNPDFMQLAAAYGVAGSRARGPDELTAAVRAALDREGPSLIEVPDQWRFLRDLATPVPTPKVDSA
jgi:acetolactate synthase-1/2/3 large subunit